MVPPQQELKKVTEGRGVRFVTLKVQQQKDISLKIESDESQIILVLGDAKVLNIFPKKKMLKDARVRKRKSQNAKFQKTINGEVYLHQNFLCLKMKRCLMSFKKRRQKT